MTSDIWGTHNLETDYSREIGDIRLTAKLVEKDELWISTGISTRISTREKHPIKPPEEGLLKSDAGEDLSDDVESTDWSRWVLKKPTESFNIYPAFPDKPVVVVPENSLRLLPGVETRIYVRVPVWLAIKVNHKDKLPLKELPSTVLSLTWFGGPTEGELCYWIESRAQRKVALDGLSGNLAICPVQLKNSSPEDLMVEKICLRVQWLSLYRKDGVLWSNETKVNYRGGTDMSQVSVTAGPPQEASKASLAGASRHVLKKSFSMRTFFGLSQQDPVRGVEPD